jgi:hypothetical protein
MPTTWWPEASRRAVTAPPIRPVAPITRTRTLIPPFRLARRPPGAPFEQENLIVSGFLPPAGRVGCRLWDRLLRPFSPPGQWQQQRRLAPIRPGALTLGRGPRTCCFTRHFLRQAALQRGHQIDHRWRRADRLWFDRQPLHLCFDQFGQGVLVAVPIVLGSKCPVRCRIIAPAMATISASTSPSVAPNCAGRTSSAARNVNSAIPVPRGSTITARSRRLSRTLPRFKHKPLILFATGGAGLSTWWR